MEISSDQITRKVIERYPDVISQGEAVAITEAIEDFICYKLLNDESISIDKFGTICSYYFHGHKAVGLNGKETFVERFKLVKFVISPIFKKLLIRKKRLLNKI